MLSNLATCSPARSLTVTVNGRKLEALKNETILELCDRHNIKIPRLCHHPSLPPRASCRVCLVECNGKWLSPACVTTVWDGLSVTTQSKKVEESVRANLAMLLETHDERCTSCVANDRCQFRDMVYEYDVQADKREPAAPGAIDKTTKTIQMDMAKCVLCGRCVRACESVSGQNAIQFAHRACHMTVEPAAGVPLAKTSCVQCGQCTLFCPVGAVTEKSEAVEVSQKLKQHKAKFNVAQLDPACGLHAGEACGEAAGADNTGKMITSLKNLGFDMVFSTETGNDLYVIEQAEELVKLFKNSKAKFPLIGSACPAIINFIEKSKPELIKQLATTRTPDQIMSALIKSKLLEKQPGMKINAEDIYTVTVTPCLAKKDAITRDGLETKAGIQETDNAITTREWAQMMKSNSLKLQSLPAGKFDAPYGEGSACAKAFVAAGGMADAVVRTAYKQMTGKNLGKLEFQQLKSIPAKVATVEIDGKQIKVAVAEGTGNVSKLLDAIAKGAPEAKGIAYVEAIACPHGCVVGGGSPQYLQNDAITKRKEAVAKAAAKAKAQTPLDNAAVVKIHEDVHKTHALLHAKYSKKK